jgi:NTE family protein
MQWGELPRPIGYVLGGGGSLGAIQVGMLQALSEHDVAPDLVAGTSVGSLNGAVLALDPKGAANRLSHTWARVTTHDVFPGNLLVQAGALRHRKTHLFPNSGLSAMVADFLGDIVTFADLALPFAAVAMDIVTGKPYPIQEGPLLPALLASAAIPGIFPAVEHDGHHLYDGGLVANVPIRQAVAMGARSVVVLDCNFPGQMPYVPSTLAEALLYSMMVMMRGQSAADTLPVAATLPVVYLPGPAAQPVSSLDFSHTAALVESSYEAARSFLADLEVSGPGLYGSPGG